MWQVDAGNTLKFNQSASNILNVLISSATTRDHNIRFSSFELEIVKQALVLIFIQTIEGKLIDCGALQSELALVESAGTPSATAVNQTYHVRSITSAKHHQTMPLIDAFKSVNCFFKVHLFS